MQAAAHVAVMVALVKRPLTKGFELSTSKNSVLTVFFMGDYRDVLCIYQRIFRWRMGISRIPEITPDEITWAELKCIRVMQREGFPKELALLLDKKRDTTGPCKNLDLYLDEHQVIKCRGRIDHLILPEKECEPILIDVKNPMVYAIIMSIHRHAACASKNNTIHRVKLKFYGPRLRSEVKKVNNRCNCCRYLRAQP